MPNLTSTLSVGFPALGYAENSAFSQQPPNTSRSLMNVRPYDVFHDRATGGIREGTKKWIEDAVNGTEQIQLIKQFTLIRDARSVLERKLLYEDTFTGTNGADIDDNNVTWSEFFEHEAPGTRANPFQSQRTGDAIWEIQSNKADFATGQFVASNTGGYGILKVGEDFNFPRSKKFVAKVKVTTFVGETTSAKEYFAGIVFRLKKSTEEFFAVGWHRTAASDEHTIKLIKMTGNTYSELATSSALGVNDTDEHQLILKHKKGYIEVYWDGVRYIDYDASSDGFTSDDHQKVGLVFMRHMDATGTWTGTDKPKFDDFQLWSAKNPSVFREEKLLVVAGGSIYVGDKRNGLTVPVNGSSALRSDIEWVEGVFAFQKFWLVDGTQYKVYDPGAGSVSTWSATAGSLPGTGSDRARLITLWHGRIVLSGVESDPHNWFMSKIGDPQDWNYTGLAGAAVAGNNADLGKIGEPITALISSYEHTMVFGCVNSIWRLDNDPTIDGTLAAITYELGVAGQRAFVQGEDKTLWIMSSNGLHALSPNAFNVDQTNRVSANRLDFTFGKIDYTTHAVQLCWNQKWHSLMIFITPEDQDTATHWILDTRTKGFFPIQFPEEYGPTAVHEFKGDAPDDRELIIGGFDSFLYAFTSKAGSDDGDEIESHVAIGPFMPNAPGLETRYSEFRATFGERSDAADYELRLADTAEAALVATPRVRGTWGAGRNPSHYIPSTGYAAYLIIGSNDSDRRWVMEQIDIVAAPAGRVRDRLNIGSQGQSVRDSGASTGPFRPGDGVTPPPLNAPPTVPPLIPPDIGDHDDPFYEPDIGVPASPLQDTPFPSLDDPKAPTEPFENSPGLVPASTFVP